MKIAVLGAQGLLGQEFSKLSDEVINFTKQDCDITSHSAILSMLKKKPGVVINCAGIVRSRIDDYSPTKVLAINSVAPHTLGAECLYHGARLIQISTDCVFDGKSQTSYNETDQPTPEDFYAVSKLAGELNCFKHTTIRTSFIGPNGGLLSWARQARYITGYDEEWWNGLSSRRFAQWVLQYIKRDTQHKLIHVFGPTYNKYEVLRIANDVFGWHLDIKPGPTPPERRRSRILTSIHHTTIDESLHSMLEGMK
jgi:dTDP-4-dehydrorhamnose reductase